MERADWDRRYRGTELVWTAQPNRFVVEELGELPPGRGWIWAAGKGATPCGWPRGAGK